MKIGNIVKHVKSNLLGVVTQVGTNDCAVLWVGSISAIVVSDVKQLEIVSERIEALSLLYYEESQKRYYLISKMSQSQAIAAIKECLIKEINEAGVQKLHSLVNLTNKTDPQLTNLVLRLAQTTSHK